MEHLLPWLACLGLAMYQYHATQTIQLMLTGNFPPEQLHLAAAGYCCGIVAGWAAVSVAARPGRGPGIGSAGKMDRLPVLFAIAILAAPGVRLYLFDGWQSQAARAAIQIGSGFLLVVAHWLFFTLIRERLQASLYCGALATGFALAEIHYRIVYAGTGGASVLLHRTLIFTTILYALILVAGTWLSFRARAIEPDTRTAGAENLHTAGSLVLVVAVLYLLHGMVDGTFLPFHPASRIQDSRVVTTVLTVLFLGVGAWLFRHGIARSFRPVITICGILHMAMAVFSLFSTDLAVIRILHILIGPAQYLVIAMAVCALAATAPRRWLMAAVTIPFALKAAEIMFIPFLLRSAIGKGEALPLAAILAAVAFYALSRRIDPAPFDGAENRLLQPLPATTTVDGNATMSRRKIVTELGDRYGFSARERQVGELLASGMSADRIGEQLGLSTNTVNTYVRRIVVKTGCGGRRGFVAMVQGGSDEKD
ncbi:MAG: helix-turn-helix transcriptional regulator [Planctomycetes bacterium]|nr:helix-turn-helix transcriptional regulator [Planctomycetota bacterium]